MCISCSHNQRRATKFEEGSKPGIHVENTDDILVALPVAGAAAISKENTPTYHWSAASNDVYQSAADTKTENLFFCNMRLLHVKQSPITKAHNLMKTRPEVGSMEVPKLLTQVAVYTGQILVDLCSRATSHFIRSCICVLVLHEQSWGPKESPLSDANFERLILMTCNQKCSILMVYLFKWVNRDHNFILTCFSFWKILRLSNNLSWSKKNLGFLVN